MPIEYVGLFLLNPMAGFLDEVHFEVAALLRHVFGEFRPQGRVSICREHQTWDIQRDDADIGVSVGIAIDVAIPVDAAAESRLGERRHVVFEVGSGLEEDFFRA